MTSTQQRPNSVELKEAFLKELTGPFQQRPHSYELKDIKQQAKKLDGQELFDFYCKTVSYYLHTIEGNVGDGAIDLIYDALKGIVAAKGYSPDDLFDYHMATSTHALANAYPSPFSLKAKEIYSRNNIYKRLGFDPSSVIQIQSEHLKSKTAV